MEECHKLLTDQVDDAILRYNVSKPLPLGGEPGHVTIQPDFFFNKDLEYLRYGRKCLSFLDAEECKYDIELCMKYPLIGGFKDNDSTLTDSHLKETAELVKEFKIKRLNSGMNTCFWTKKDMTRSIEFITTIKRRLKTRRIYRNLECFVDGRVRDIDYRLL
ncbi:hypothetical protein Tco_1523003 [Tanacetum coccineum]